MRIFLYFFFAFFHLFFSFPMSYDFFFLSLRNSDSLCNCLLHRPLAIIICQTEKRNLHAATPHLWCYLKCKRNLLLNVRGGNDKSPAGTQRGRVTVIERPLSAATASHCRPGEILDKTRTSERAKASLLIRRHWQTTASQQPTQTGNREWPTGHMEFIQDSFFPLLYCAT